MLASFPTRLSKDYSKLIVSSPKGKIKKILIAHPQPEGLKSPYFDLERKFDVKFTFFPFIDVQGVSNKDFRKQKLILTDFSGIIFTSRNAIDHFFRICDEVRVKISQETKFFCTSEAISLYLQKYTQYRKRKVFYSDKSSNKDLRTQMLKHKDSTKFLYICPEVSSKEEILDFMNLNGIDYNQAVMYKTVSNDLTKIAITDFDMLVFFSPAHVSSLLESYPNYKQNNQRIGVFGTTTADAVLDAKLNIHVMAPIDGISSITAAIEKYLS